MSVLFQFEPRPRNISEHNPSGSDRGRIRRECGVTESPAATEPWRSEQHRKLHLQMAGKSSQQGTVNSLMFARDLFGDFHDHIEIAKINTRKHN